MELVLLSDSFKLGQVNSHWHSFRPIISSWSNYPLPDIQGWVNLNVVNQNLHSWTLFCFQAAWSLDMVRSRSIWYPWGGRRLCPGCQALSSRIWSLGYLRRWFFGLQCSRVWYFYKAQGKSVDDYHTCNDNLFFLSRKWKKPSQRICAQTFVLICFDKRIAKSGRENVF